MSTRRSREGCGVLFELSSAAITATSDRAGHVRDGQAQHEQQDSILGASNDEVPLCNRQHFFAPKWTALEPSILSQDREGAVCANGHFRTQRVPCYTSQSGKKGMHRC